MRAAGLSGVKVKLVRVMTFVFCSVFAVLGGIMVAGYGGVNVTIGEGMEMQAIAACVIGGVLLGGGKGNVIQCYFWRFYLTGDRQPVESAWFTQAIYGRSPGLDHHWSCGVLSAQHDEKAVNRIADIWLL